MDSIVRKLFNYKIMCFILLFFYLYLGVIMSGGDKITSYVPNLGIQESFCENRDKPIWKVRYTSNGSFLYSVCEGGVVRKYRRYPDRHEYLGEVYTHKGDIQDLDISPYDECILLIKTVLQKKKKKLNLFNINF